MKGCGVGASKGQTAGAGVLGVVRQCNAKNAGCSNLHIFLMPARSAARPTAPAIFILSARMSGLRDGVALVRSRRVYGITAQSDTV